jgi:hypothetical protein
VPVVVTAKVVVVVCGLRVNVDPETQYAYGVPLYPSEIVITPPEIVYEPPVDALTSIDPIPPVWLAFTVHVHPPVAVLFEQLPFP